MKRPLALLSTLLIASPLLAQVAGGSSEALYQWHGSLDSEAHGYAVSGGGDVNGDGIPDLISSATGTSAGALPDAGSVYVYSGADGSLIHQWNGTQINEQFGKSIADAGDVNGDGFADVLVGAPNHSPNGLLDAGSVFLFSGADGSQLYRWDGLAYLEKLGISVSRAGDINGDGYSDVIFGAPGTAAGGLSASGTAFVYSGIDGSLLYRFDGSLDSASLGVSVSHAGDVNNDGRDDVIVGASGDFFARGKVFVFSGMDGSTLYQWKGDLIAHRFGKQVSDAGDVNLDGFADLLVSSRKAEADTVTDAGTVRVYSGINGSILGEWSGTLPTAFFGESIDGAGDVDGDSYPDLLIGVSGDPFYDVRLYSGLNGSLLHTWSGESAVSSVGQSVSTAGDVDLDGFPDIIFGDRGADFGGINSSGTTSVVNFHAFMRADIASVSTSAGGALNLNLEFPDAAGLQDYMVLMSTQGTGPIFYGVEIPLTLDGFLINSSNGIYPFAITSNLHGTLDPIGDATASITFPAGAFQVATGRTFWLAAVAFPTGQRPAFSSVAVPVVFTP